MIKGKLEITIKVNELPNAVEIENKWMQFSIDCNGEIVTITIKPKVWKKFTDAQENYKQWVAAIAGSKGEATDDGFNLDNPSIQIFEKKAKEEKVE